MIKLCEVVEVSRMPEAVVKRGSPERCEGEDILYTRMSKNGRMIIRVFLDTSEKSHYSASRPLQSPYHPVYNSDSPFYNRE